MTRRVHDPIERSAGIYLNSDSLEFQGCAVLLSGRFALTALHVVAKANADKGEFESLERLVLKDGHSDALSQFAIEAIHIAGDLAVLKLLSPLDRIRETISHDALSSEAKRSDPVEVYFAKHGNYAAPGTVSGLEQDHFVVTRSRGEDTEAKGYHRGFSGAGVWLESNGNASLVGIVQRSTEGRATAIKAKAVKKFLAGTDILPAFKSASDGGQESPDPLERRRLGLDKDAPSTLVPNPSCAVNLGIAFVIALCSTLIAFINNISRDVEGLAAQIKLADQAVALPVGSVVAWPMDFGSGREVPAGWLICDGSTHGSDRYPLLGELLRDKYGPSKKLAEGVFSFQVPDYRGQFLRGANGSAERKGKKLDMEESDRIPLRAGWPRGGSIGSFQDDAIKSHKHPLKIRNVLSKGGGGEGGALWYEELDGETADFGGVETRPKNLTVHWLIKSR